MKIVEWIDYEEAEGKEENGLGGCGGFFKKGMRWKDYSKGFTIRGKIKLRILRKEIIKKELKYTGRIHQEGCEAVPLWSNGKVDTYSYRAWGDLMAAIWSTEENRDYSYMDFYC